MDAPFAIRSRAADITPRQIAVAPLHHGIERSSMAHEPRYADSAITERPGLEHRDERRSRAVDVVGCVVEPLRRCRVLLDVRDLGTPDEREVDVDAVARVD